MRAISTLFAIGTADYRPRPGKPLDIQEAAAWPIGEVYDLLEAYYLNNGLYWSVERALYDQGLWREPIRPLRNPAHRAVEFYPAKLWPGTLPEALPLVVKDDQVRDAIYQIWQWSNWGAQKQVFARKLAMLGDVFLKVAQNATQSRVFVQLIDPRYVPDDGFETDERGYLTWIRLDIPQQRRGADGEVEEYWWTEVWDKRGGYLWLRVWEHKDGIGAELESLGDPMVERFSGEPGNEEEAELFLSFDFIPIVHARFQDIGDDRGLAAISPAVDKIDELNRVITRLHQILYNLNDVLWALRANATDASGRPVPAPPIKLEGTALEAGDVVTLGGQRMIRLPGTSELQPLVPDIDYEAALKVVEAQLGEIEQDLPELAYFRLREMGELSGRAVAMLLGDAVDRALEVRGNGETAMIRAQEMALTIGREVGLFPESIGSWEDGDFEHSFKKRPVIEVSSHEKWETIKLGVEAGTALTTMLRRVLGADDEEIALILQESADQQNRERLSLAEATLNAARALDRGEQDQGLTNA